MNKSLNQIEADALQEIDDAADQEERGAVYTKYLGRKGLLTQFLRNISSLPVDERPQAGKQANLLKKRLEDAFASPIKHQGDQALAEGKFVGLDVSLPGRLQAVGTLHPITQATREICDILVRMGFEV